MDATAGIKFVILKDSSQLITDYVGNLHNALNQLSFDLFDEAIKALLLLKENNKHLYICGNGGSAANAMHLANDFCFGVAPNGNAIKVEALSANSAILTCLGNDIEYKNIFSHQLKVKANQGDILMVLSGSGNSSNIIKALEQAKIMNMTTIAIVGFDGGKAKQMADIVFHFDINDMQISEDTQIIIGHLIMKALNQELLNG